MTDTPRPPHPFTTHLTPADRAAWTAVLAGNKRARLECGAHPNAMPRDEARCCAACIHLTSHDTGLCAACRKETP